MVARRRPAPDTIPSPEDGRPMHRDVRPATITYKGASMVIELPGYYPDGDGESIHVGADLACVDEALKILKSRCDESGDVNAHDESGTPSPP